MPHADVSRRLRSNAKGMRRKLTDAELKFWNAVRAHRLERLGFRRQLPVLGYIADFACPEHRLIVEIDGSQHAEARALHDLRRTETLERNGWMVLRFWNDEVLHDIDNVCLHIVKVLGIDKAEPHP